MKIKKVHGRPSIYDSSCASHIENYPIKIGYGEIEPIYKIGAILWGNEFRKEEEIEKLIDERGELLVDESDFQQIIYLDNAEIATKFEKYFFYNEHFHIYIGNDNFDFEDVIIENESSVLTCQIYFSKYEDTKWVDIICFIDGQNIDNYNLHSLTNIKENIVKPAIDFTKDEMRKLIIDGFEDLSFEDSVKNLLTLILNVISAKISEKETNINNRLNEYDL